MNPNNLDFIPYGSQNITDDDIAQVLKVLKSPLITQGEVVPKFEKEVASFVNAKYSVAVNSATSALHLACLSLDLGPGDILWTSPITFVASSNCGLYCGAKVDFVDIEPKNGLMNMKLLEKKLKIASSIGKLPKIIIPVHLSGTSCDMKTLKKLSDIYGFKIIEDASHAIGASINNIPVGSCFYSDVTVFSFHPVKIITTGEGGMATTNDKNIHEKIKLLRSHGIEKDSKKFIFSEKGPWSYEQQFLGFNYRMTDFQAALGLSQLKRLKTIIKQRNKKLSIYKDHIKKDFYRFLEIPVNVTSSVHLAIILLKKIDPRLHLKLFNYLRRNNIGVQLHYSPVYAHPYYQKLGFKKKDFPFSEDYAASAMSIPLFPNLSENDQERVINLLNNFANK